MRIAFITNLFPPIQTGSAYWTQQAVIALAARGHRVVVITCAPGAAEEKMDLVGDAPVYRLPTLFHFPKLNFFLNFDQFYLMASPRNARRVREILRDEEIEIIHQAGHLLDSTLLSTSAARALKIPSVCSIHTRIGHPTSAAYDVVMRAADRAVLGPRIMRKFDRLMALDEVLRLHYERVYSVDSIAVVPVCVEDSILDLPAAEPGDTSPARIVSVGHVTEMRDRRELLLAIAELRRRGVPVHLDIVGKVLTEVTPRLVRELSLGDTVTLLGELPRDRLFKLLRASSLEMHWIDIQGIGLAAMEAMAIGLPVAAWASEDIYGEDVPLEHLENIVLIDPHDGASLVRTVEHLIREPDLRRRIGLNARELVRQHLTWHSVAARLEAVYTQAISAR
jgi:glycosyltransferase involved in cell wall biosynthesis